MNSCIIIVHVTSVPGLTVTELGEKNSALLGLEAPETMDTACCANARVAFIVIVVSFPIIPVSFLIISCANPSGTSVAFCVAAVVVVALAAVAAASEGL